jgi:ABC-type glycerol-3-phosphate transport system permease component
MAENKWQKINGKYYLLYVEPASYYNTYFVSMISFEVFADKLLDFLRLAFTILLLNFLIVMFLAWITTKSAFKHITYLVEVFSAAERGEIIEKPQLIIIPRYTIFRSPNVLDSYWPFYLTAIFACYPFFTYMLIQFLRGLPRDLDESAYIDGCGTFKTFTNILLPLLKPSLFSAGLFQFLWTYNDYFNSLIYINTVKKYTISLALRLSLDAENVVQWNKVMAMSCVAVLPVVVLFFCCQKYFVDGIATTGLKG